MFRYSMFQFRFYGKRLNYLLCKSHNIKLQSEKMMPVFGFLIMKSRYVCVIEEVQENAIL